MPPSAQEEQEPQGHCRAWHIDQKFKSLFNSAFSQSTLKMFLSNKLVSIILVLICRCTKPAILKYDI